MSSACSLDSTRGTITPLGADVQNAQTKARMPASGTRAMGTMLLPRHEATISASKEISHRPCFHIENYKIKATCQRDIGPMPGVKTCKKTICPRRTSPCWSRWRSMVIRRLPLRHTQLCTLLISPGKSACSALSVNFDMLRHLSAIDCQAPWRSIRPMSRNNSSVQAMECGDCEDHIFHGSQRRVRAEWFLFKTSSAAPPIFTPCNASIRAASSTIGPRAVLISTASFFMRANCGFPSKPRVRCERAVDQNVVGRAQKLIKQDQIYTKLGGPLAEIYRIKSQKPSYVESSQQTDRLRSRCCLCRSYPQRAVSAPVQVGGCFPPSAPGARADPLTIRL